MKKREEAAISAVMQILVLLIAVATVGAALYVYLSREVGPSVSTPTGFTQTGQTTQGGNTITTYSGTGTTTSASSAFKTWMEGQGWQFKTDNGSFGGYTGQLYEKGSERTVVQATSTQADQVTVTVVSGPKPSGPAENQQPPAVENRYDFGDAPDPTYPSLLASNGARHKDTTRAWFGDNADNETDARVTDLDNFDDGLTFFNPLIPISFTVTNNNWSGNLFVNILIDNNNDGDWADNNEWVVQNFQVSVPQGQSQEFDTSVCLPLERWMRMTLTGVSLTNYVGTGEFEIGETEDHVRHVPSELTPCWFNIELEPETQVICHSTEANIRIVLKAGHAPVVDNSTIKSVAAGVVYPPYLGLPEPAEVQGVSPPIEVSSPIGIPAANPVQINNLRIDPPDPGDPADTLGWIRFNPAFDVPERNEVIEITVKGKSAARVDYETAEVTVQHRYMS